MGSNEIERVEFTPMKAEDRALALSSEQSVWLNVAKFEQFQRVAQMISKTDFIPANFKNNVGNCMIVLDLADRLRMHPIMLMQTMYVVHGRPGFEGKFMSALVNNSGRDLDPLEYEWKGAKGKPNAHHGWGCRAYATRKSTGKVVFGPWVDWEMVVAEGWNKPKGFGEKQQASKWVTMPELMFMYRAAAYFVNTNDSDLKMGMPTVEEVEDMSVDLIRSPSGDYTTGTAEKNPELYKVTGKAPEPEKPKQPESQPTAAEPEPEQKQESQQEQVSTPDPSTDIDHWSIEVWKMLRSTGTKKHAEQHRETFHLCDLETRAAFHQKWSSCQGLDVFPFDAEGKWIGYGSQPKLVGPEKPSEKQAPEKRPADESENLELLAQFNETFIHGNAMAKAYAGDMVGCKSGRPENGKIKTWLTYYGAFMDKERAREAEKSRPDENAPKAVDDNAPDFGKF